MGWANGFQTRLTAAFARDVEDPRTRKLVLLICVSVVCCVAPLGLYLWLGLWVAVLTNSLVSAIALVSLWMLRRGASSTRVAMVFLIGVLLVVAPCGVMAPRDLALLVFAWLTIYPLSANALGGPRVGLAVFAVTMVLLPVLVVLQASSLFPTLLDEVRFSNPVSYVVMLLTMCLSMFMLGRGYENENERRIAQLDARNKELLEAQRAGEVANRARTQFLATISHELRTPLNGLIGMTAALRGEKRPERVEEGLGVLQTSADALLSVINDVLDFTKIEAGALELEHAAVSPSALASEVLEVLRARAGERQNTLELEVAPGTHAWVQGDATRLRQILFNLVGNAIKFTEHGHVRCRVATEGTTFSITVSDDGVGMSAETLARICAPFVQADASTTRKYGGTGLGLAITRRLVHAMGGRFDIDSVLGRGSTFRVSLPYVAAQAPASPTSTPLPGAALEVLVVDDNAVNQLVAGRLLERMGHRATRAGDGRAAVELVRSQHFDLVLMDCHMPVMDGYEATRLLRAEGHTLPIFALTAAVTTEDTVACERAGMTQVLHKPLRIDQLEDALAAVAGRRNAA